MKKFMIGLSVIGLMALSACGGKSEAVEATEAEEGAEASAEAKSFAVDTETSVVNWRGYKIYEGKTEEEGHNGYFKLSSGTVSTKDGKLEAGEFVIDVNSVTATDDAYGDTEEEIAEGRMNLVGHLKEADFLDAANHPTAKFVITEVATPEEAKAEKFNTLIKGNLTLRGVEKNIPFHANVEVTNDGVKIYSEDFFINRKDFGSEYTMKGGLLKNDVGIQIDVNTAQVEQTELTETEATEETAE